VELPAEIVSFFKGIKIVVEPSLEGNPGHFSVHDGVGIVSIQSFAFSDDKPIPLHELLHAYHYYILSINNKNIQDAYDSVKHGGAYPAGFQKSHFLSNRNEFFAISSTIYHEKIDHLMNNAFTVSVPHLQTERLLLREYRRDDFDVFAHHCSAPLRPA
jgi:hypothetical protein